MQPQAGKTGDFFQIPRLQRQSFSGNLLNDTFHSYTWDAYGNVSTIATPPNGSAISSVVYDANGNKVEENVSGTIHEYVSAFGVTAQMTGQTENSTIVPLPGGVQALYSGGTLKRFGYPDLQGSIRAESDPVARAFTESLAFAPFGGMFTYVGTVDSSESSARCRRFCVGQSTFVQ